MIMQILAIVDRRLLDLADGRVHFGDGDIFLAAHCGIARTMLEHPARGAKIGQCVQIGRMRPRGVRVGSQRQRKHQGNSSQNRFESGIHETSVIDILERVEVYTRLSARTRTGMKSV